MTAAETIAETTSMKIAGMCRTGSRIDEIIVETTTMIVETTVVGMRVGLDIPRSGGALILVGRRSSSSRTVTAITNAMANGSVAPIMVVRWSTPSLTRPWDTDGDRRCCITRVQPERLTPDRADRLVVGIGAVSAQDLTRKIEYRNATSSGFLTKLATDGAVVDIAQLVANPFTI